MARGSWISIGLAVVFVSGALFPVVAGAETLPQSEIDRFIRVWTERFDDNDWMSHYLNSTDVVDDGFGALDDESKRLLVDRLMTSYEAHSGRFFDMLNPQDATVAEVEERHNTARGILHGVIFDKAAFTEKLLGNDKSPPTPELRETRNPESEFFPGMTLDEVTRQINAENEKTMELTDITSLLEAVDLSRTGELQDATTEIVPVEKYPVSKPIDLETALADAGYEAPELSEVEIPLVPTTQAQPMVDLDHEIPVDLKEILPTELVGAMAPTPGEVIGILNTVVSAVTYSVCWQKKGETKINCSPVPAPLNVPLPVDIDGDRVPDVVVTATVPVSLPALPDVSVSLDLRRTDARTLSNPLPVFVYAVYKIPGASDQYAIAGFDGRETTLPGATTVTVSITDLLTDNPGVHARVATGQAGSASTLVAGLVKGTADANGNLVFSDPILASLRFSPVPAVFIADLTQQSIARFIGTTLDRGRNFTLALSSTAPTRVTPTVYIERTAGTVRSADIIQMDANQLPTDAKINAVVYPSHTALEYTASAKIGTVSFLMANVPNLAMPATYRLSASATLTGLPTRVKVTADTGSSMEVHYEADARIQQITFATGDVKNGQFTSLTYAQVDDIPMKIDFTSANGRTDFVADTPIGAVSFFAFSGQGPLYALPGDHFLSHAQTYANGDKFQLMSARISGVKEVHASVGGSRQSATVVLRGGQSFYAMMKNIEASGKSTTLLGYISNLPSTITVTAEGTTFSYEASSIISQVAVSMETIDGSSRTLLYGAIYNVPAAVTLAFDAAANQILYEASSSIPKIVVAMEKTSPGRYDLFIGEVNDLPKTIRIQWSLVTNTFAFSTDQKLGRIFAQAYSQSGSGTLFAFAEVKSLPTTIVAKFDPAGTIDFTTDSYIGEITVAASNFGGYFPISGDGVLAYARGGLKSIYGRISGLAGFHASVQQKHFALELAHPTPLTVLALTESPTLGQQTAYLYMSSLPANVQVAFGGDSVMYKASSKINRVDAVYQDATQSAFVTLTGVPSDILFTFGPTPSFTMVDTLDRVNFGYARGMGIYGACCGDHVVYYKPSAWSPAFSVSGQISYIRSFLADLAQKHISVDLSNNLPFFALAQTPDVYAYVTLSNVPGHITVDAQANAFSYSATNPINRITAYIVASGNTAYASVIRAPRLLTASWSSNMVTVHTDQPIQNIQLVGANSQGVVSVNIDHIPSTMRVMWNIGTGSGNIVYDADGILGGVTVQASSGSKGAFLQILGIPEHMQVSWGDKNVQFSTSSPIGSIWAMATNDGSFSALGGDHLFFWYPGSGATRVSFKLSGLSGFSYNGNGATQTFSLNLAGGNIFNIYAYYNSGGSRVYASGYIGPLPASTYVALGTTTLVSMSSNMNIQMYVEAGSNTALDGDGWWTPPVENPGYYTHGLVARANSGMNAIKATLFLTGLPTYVFLDPNNQHYVVNGFNPSWQYNWIFMDFKKPGLHGRAYIGSPANNYDFRIVSGDKYFAAYMYANRNMGQVWADVVTPDHHLYGFISNIPATMSFVYQGGEASTYAFYSANIPIGEIFVGYNRPWVGYYQAWLQIQNIPSYMYFNLGKTDFGPVLTYYANANYLTARAFVHESLFSGNLRARIYLEVRNIGGYTTAWKGGDGAFNLYSSPGIGLFYVDVSATYTWSYSKANSYSAWWFGFSYHVYISVYVAINNLYLYAEGIRQIALKPGFVLDFNWFDSDYFSFGWNTIYVSLSFDVGVSVSILGWDIISPHLHWYPSFYVWSYFDTYAWHRYRVWSYCAWGACAWFDAAPHPHYRFYNGFALWGNEDSWNRYRYVAIDPFDIIPDWLLWIYVTASRGGFWWGCC